MEVNETNVKTIKTSELVQYLIKNYTKNSDSFKYVHTFDKMQIKMFPYLSEKNHKYAHKISIPIKVNNCLLPGYQVLGNVSSYDNKKQLNPSIRIRLLDCSSHFITMLHDLIEYIKDDYIKNVKSYDEKDLKELKRFMDLPSNIIDVDTLYCRFYDNIKVKVVKEGNKICKRSDNYKLGETSMLARVFLRPTYMFISTSNDGSTKRFKIQFYVSEIHKLEDVKDTFIDEDGNVQSYDHGNDDDSDMLAINNVTISTDDNTVKKPKSRQRFNSSDED